MRDKLLIQLPGHSVFPTLLNGQPYESQPLWQYLILKIKFLFVILIQNILLYDQQMPQVVTYFPHYSRVVRGYLDEHQQTTE